MRGISDGQQITLLIIPEVSSAAVPSDGPFDGLPHQVLELMGRQLAKAGHIDSETNVLVAALKRDETLPSEAPLPMTARPAATTTRAQLQRMLRDVAAWLVINAMKSERVQFDQLCHQNLCNIWRQRAHEQLLAGHTLFRVPKEVAASYVHQALGEAFLSNREGAVGRAKLDGKALANLSQKTGDSYIPLTD